MGNVLATRFLETLQSIRGAGRFCSQGSFPFRFPGICLKSGEELAFPLPPSQAVAVRSEAEAAPYGMGAETRRDDSVRRCWQIDAAELEWSRPDWQEGVEELAQWIAGDLGVEGKVTAVAYKLLLYETGGFFLPHRDTEKAPGMFGTLILCLPSKHKGGALRVRHHGREECVDFSACHEPAEIQYAAFFADCEHEVLPVTQGYRLCLAYNLLLQHGSKAPPFSASPDAAGLLAPGLRQVADAAGEDLTAILLEHRYTEEGLSIAALKGDDRARAAALFAATEAAGLSARLALVSFYQMGQLEEDYETPYRRRRSRRGFREDSTAEGEMGEVYEESLTIDHWRTPLDVPDAMGSFAIDHKRILSLASLGEGEPDEKYAEGFTGNAGCTMEHWYRRAAIVVWPQDSDPSLMARYDFDAANASFLATAKGHGESTPLARLGMALLDEAARRFVTLSEYQATDLAISLRPLLHGIALRGAGDLFARMMNPAFLPAFVQADGAIWQALIHAFGDKSVDFLLSKTSPENLYQNRGALFHALDAALSEAPGLAAKLAPLAADWLTAAPVMPAFRFRSESPVPPALMWHFAAAASCFVTEKIPREKLERALWAEGTLQHLRELVAPGLQHPSHQAWLCKPNSLAPALLEATVNAFAEECAKPLVSYPNWSRPVGKSASTEPLIQELLAFMTDPAAREYRFRKRQDLRQLIERYVHDHHLDLDLTVEMRGTPHTLVCRKNDASFQRSRKRREEDERLLVRLRKLAESLAKA